MSSFKIIDTGKSKIDVCIAMLAYNHEKYIAYAIESVLMQKTSYAYKIIIAEDHSTDSTKKIILEYQKKYPDKIKLLLQEENVGAQQNNIDLLSNLEGKYVAALEGDDYWTDPLKLQKQVDFLEANNEYSVCGTYCDILKTNKVETPNQMFFQSFNFYSLIENNRIPTLTICFRSKALNVLELNKENIFDTILLFELTKNGDKIAKLPYNTAAYRYHGFGASSGNSELENTKIQFDYKIKYFKNNNNFKNSFYLKKYYLKTGFNQIKNLIKGRSTNFKIIKLSLNYLFKI